MGRGVNPEQQTPARSDTGSACSIRRPPSREEWLGISKEDLALEEEWVQHMPPSHRLPPIHNLRDIGERLERIRRIVRVGDIEVAESERLELFTELLKSIASGAYEGNAEDLARTALITEELEIGYGFETDSAPASLKRSYVD